MSEQAAPEKETPYIAAARRQWELEKQASEQKKIRVVKGKIVTYTPPPPPYDLETTLMMAHAAEERVIREAIDAKLNGPNSAAIIGQMIEGRGIFFGTWEPKDKSGKSLGKIFNLFAAPQNMPSLSGPKDLHTYNEALKRTSEVKDLCGHDGALFKDETELYSAIKNDSYKGEWFMPTLDILSGMNAEKRPVQQDNLFRYHDTGLFKDNLVKTSEVTTRAWYWSFTKDHFNQNRAYNVRLTDRKIDLNTRDLTRLSVRLVRAEPRP